MNYKQQFENYVNIFENCLQESVKKFPDGVIGNAMKYAVTDGGKRIRPVLCFSTADMLGINLKDVENYALAIEFIHSYSLVHDDLPCMDNDDYRRGKLSTHKKFGQAFGVLCGDALLNYAYELVLLKEKFTENDRRALALLANYAGSFGMIKGQELDLNNESNANIDEKTLFEIYINKTSKLLTAPLLISSILSNGKFFDELKEFGESLGIMFQITDDIIDVEGNFELIGKTPNKDVSSDKLTSVKVYGLGGAKEKAKQYYEKCKDILFGLKNSEFLLELVDKMYLRKF